MDPDGAPVVEPPTPVGVAAYPTSTATAPTTTPVIAESPAIQSSTQPRGPTAGRPPPECEGHECPVCLDEISAQASAMRCAGDGGVEHYFHAKCLAEWIRSQRSDLSTPSCPVCRGPIRVHRQRLQRFLDQPAAGEALDPTARGFLFTLLHSGDRGGGWSLELTSDHVKAFALAGSAFVSGLTRGALARWPAAASLATNRANGQGSAEAIATSVGLAIGSLFAAGGGEERRSR